MSRVVVNEGILWWASERAGLTPIDIENRLPGFPQWIIGERKPTLRQLDKLARITRTPLGDEPSRRPSPDLLETVCMMQQRQAWMRESLIERGHEPLPFVASRRNESFLAVIAASRFHPAFLNGNAKGKAIVT